eukprot:c14765_g1_i1.p1 GENE.c14765_g1_i1~~c14765_g1_i1.p1  ORF type:complete len:107 (+),score=13.64 c14765_g1_i1:397-717(+)
MSALLCALSQIGVVPALKFAVLMCGSAGAWMQYVRDLPNVVPIAVPSLHVLGELDEYLESGKLVLPAFVDPVVVYHPDTHRPLPSKRDQSLEVVGKIISFMEQHDA